MNLFVRVIRPLRSCYPPPIMAVSNSAMVSPLSSSALQVTLAVGAKKMAEEGGIVTHLTALEEIASMVVLCSDKTGTLTTNQMTVVSMVRCPLPHSHNLSLCVARYGAGLRADSASRRWWPVSDPLPPSLGLPFGRAGLPRHERIQARRAHG